MGITKTTEICIYFCRNCGQLDTEHVEHINEKTWTRSSQCLFAPTNYAPMNAQALDRWVTRRLVSDYQAACRLDDAPDPKRYEEARTRLDWYQATHIVRVWLSSWGRGARGYIPLNTPFEMMLHPTLSANDYKVIRFTPQELLYAANH